jgi:hypothetical protein
LLFLGNEECFDMELINFCVNHLADFHDVTASAEHIEWRCFISRVDDVVDQCFVEVKVHGVLLPVLDQGLTLVAD